MKMSKNIAGKTVLIVLIVLVSVFDLFWLLGIIGIGMEQSQYGIDTDYISYAKPADAPYLEEIGREYEGNAKAGYSFYRVHVPVISVGTAELSPEYDLYMEAEGEEYDDVESYYDYDSDSEQENMFTYTNVELLPAGQKGELTEVLLIQDGVEAISLTVYATSDEYYNEENGQETLVKVP